MLENELLQKFRKFDQSPSRRRLSLSRGAKRLPKTSEQPSKDSASPKLRVRKKSTPTPTMPPPQFSEERGLGTEGWLGVMVFLGVILGVIYARLALP
jgi:hypothetical protein